MHIARVSRYISTRRTRQQGPKLYVFPEFALAPSSLLRLKILVSVRKKKRLFWGSEKSFSPMAPGGLSLSRSVHSMRVRLPCAVITRKHTRKERETKSSKKPSEDETIRSAAPSIAASDPVFVFPGPLERKGRPSSSVNARPVRCCVRALHRLAAGLVYFVWPRWGRAPH